MLIENEHWGPLTKTVLDACFEVHRLLGPGLLESVYDDALAIEFGLRGIEFKRQPPIPVLYKGSLAGDPFKPDFWISEQVVLEIKAVETLHPIHEAQLLTYLRLTESPVGLLVNFHTPLLKQGIHRFLNPQKTKPLSSG